MYNSPIDFLKRLRADFYTLLQKTPSSYFKDFIRTIPSKSDKDEFWFPGSVAGFEEWLKDISYTGFDDYSLTIRNKHYQRGLMLNKDWLSDAKSTEAGTKIEGFIKEITKKYISFPDKKCEALLEANSNAFDATAMFATSRSNLDTGSNTINNLITGTLSTAYTTSTFTADFEDAEQALLVMKDKDDEPFNEAPKLIAFVPPQLKGIATTVLSERMTSYIDATTSDPVSNKYAGTAEIRVNYRQSNSNNDWYLINANADYPPFLMSDRQGVKFNMKDDSESKDIKYWAEFRIGVEFLNPMSIIKINN